MEITVDLVRREHPAPHITAFVMDVAGVSRWWLPLDENLAEDEILAEAEEAWRVVAQLLAHWAHIDLVDIDGWES